MEIGRQQQDAVAKILEWHRKESGRPFVLCGYAGTGKTTLVRYITDKLGLEAKYATLTGKAALVLRKYNDVPAQTIHSLIYKYIPPDRDLISRLMQELKRAKKGKREIRRKIKEAAEPKFILREESPLEEADLLVIDEYSMISTELLEDLLSWKKPTILLGDPGQLPPVEGQSINLRPDVVLTEIHRQSKGSGIIDAATRARKRIPPPLGKLKDDFEHKRGLSDSDLLAYDQVICGRNKTRRELNDRIRELLGRKGEMPEEGDRLICLRNYHDIGLLNGMQMEVVGVGGSDGEDIDLEVLPEDFENPIHIRAKLVREKQLVPSRKKIEVDYAYAITVHKAQGSQWPSVLFYDDGFLKWDRSMRFRWLYTGITRAAEKLLMVS